MATAKPKNLASGSERARDRRAAGFHGEADPRPRRGCRRCRRRAGASGRSRRHRRAGVRRRRCSTVISRTTRKLPRRGAASGTLTGDRARKDEDGYFWFVGRSDDVISSGAYRIGPFEVESALLEHPAGSRIGGGRQPRSRPRQRRKGVRRIAPGSRLRATRSCGNFRTIANG